MRQAIYGTVRLGLHREFSDALKRQQGGGSLAAWKTVMSSMASGALASVIGNPFDISMVRMQADSLKPLAERRGYKNVFDALARIAREEGVANLWRGFEPTVARAIAMNVGMMATYDIVKDAIVQVNGDNFSTSLASSAGAALACVVTSLPFDLIKTRLQNMKPDAAGAMPYRGVLDCAGKVASIEGPLAFWTGFGAYYGRTAPHAMIILLSMEQIKKVYECVVATRRRRIKYHAPLPSPRTRTPARPHAHAPPLPPPPPPSPLQIYPPLKPLVTEPPWPP